MTLQTILVNFLTCVITVSDQLFKIQTILSTTFSKQALIRVLWPELFVYTLAILFI